MLCALLGIWCDQVDAFYYPDANNLLVHQEFLDVGSVERCREVVYAAAAINEDPNLERGDYECGIGPQSKFGDLTVYKETTR